MEFRDGVFAEHRFQCLENRCPNLSGDMNNYYVVLEAGGVRYPALKTSLAAASPYFRQMFTNKMFKEYRDELVHLQLVDHLALKKILQFIDTSTIQIDDHDVYLLMSAADLFAMSSLKICIAKYLLATLSVENSLGVYVAAEKFSYHDLRETARLFCLTHFQQLASSPELLDLPPSILTSIVSSQLLDVEDEGTVLLSILRWAQSDPKERERHLPSILSHVRLHEVSPAVLDQVKHEGGLKWPDDFQFRLEEVLADPDSGRFRGGRVRDSTDRYAQEQAVVMAIGGESSGMASRTAECITDGYQTWRSSIPECVVLGNPLTYDRVIAAMRCARIDAVVVHDRYNVYVIGGRHSTELLDSCEAYNVQKNTWRPLPPLPKPLDGCSAALCDGRIYVAGGVASRSVWSLDPHNEQGAWIPLPPLLRSRHHHCMVGAHGFIFVIGGYLDKYTSPTQSMQRYDIADQSWLELPRMRVARAHFGAAMVDSCIYIMGGTDNIGRALRSVERYDILTSELKQMHDMLTPRFHFSVTVSDSRVFCLGGNDSLHGLYTVGKYNPRIDKWHSVSCMQVTRCGLSSASLYVPVLKNEQ